MKRLKYIPLYALLAFSTTGCSDFLNKEPLTSLSPTNYWKTEADLRMALNVLYKNMNRSYSLDNRSVDTFAAAGNSISSGIHTPPNVDGTWTSSYKWIRVANDFLANYQNAKLPEKVLNRYAGEARFFRAYFYYRLVTQFGGVKVITKTLDLDSPELQAPRDSKEKVWALIFEDLEFASKHIPLKSQMKQDVGRITKGAAQAFLSRAALYAGTHYKFHEGKEYQAYLQKAIDASNDLIESNEYELYDDYRNLFLFEGQDSDEHILSYRFSEEAGVMNTKPRLIIYDHDCEPTKFVADNFLCKDGLPIEKSMYKVEYLPLGQEFENRDPRMALTIWRPGDLFSDKPFVPNLGNQTRTGYMFKKAGTEDAFTYVPSAVYVDEILIRYAEVLVNYAEAVYELNDGISNDELDRSINLLRDRFAGHPDQLPHLTNEFVEKHNLSMREEIRRERRAEMSGEALRYDDIIRWKTAEVELPQAIKGIQFDAQAYPNIQPGKDVMLDESGFIVVQKKESRSFDVNKHYLYPIPLREISLNPNLKQNPGWN